MKNEELIIGKKIDRINPFFLLYICMFSLFVFFTCSENDKEENVDIFLVEDGIKIKNSTTSDIAYFAVDQNILAVLTWAPICGDDNEIPAGQSIIVETSSILGYGTGNIINVNYWTCPYETGDEIKTTKIEIE